MLRLMRKFSQGCVFVHLCMVGGCVFADGGRATIPPQTNYPLEEIRLGNDSASASPRDRHNPPDPRQRAKADALRAYGVVTSNLLEPSTTESSGGVSGSVEYRGSYRQSKGGVRPALVLNENNTPRDTLVFLKGTLPATHLNKTPSEIRLIDGQIKPYLTAVQVGERLRFINAEALAHTIRLLSEENNIPSFQLAPSQGFEVLFDTPEVKFVRVKCDLHLYEEARVAVLPHRFFATTGEDGKFNIHHVPPGDYTVVAWHEMLGKTEQPVRVTAGGPIQVEITLDGK